MAKYIDDEQAAELHTLLMAHKQATLDVNPGRDPSSRDSLVRVPVCNALGKYVLMVVEHCMTMPSYCGYHGAVRDDMISDALYYCTLELHHYKPDKGSAFTFLTIKIIQQFKSVLKAYYAEKAYEHDDDAIAYDAKGDIADIVIPVYDDEIVVDSALYAKCPADAEIDIYSADVDKEAHVYRYMQERLDRYRREATKASVRLVEYLITVKDKQLSKINLPLNIARRNRKANDRNMAKYKKSKTKSKNI